MATIISIETSTEVCSVALSQDGENLWEKKHMEGQAHSTLLAPYLQEMQIYINDNHIKVDAVAVSSGPGSYTGLRIGVSTAKGLCYGSDLPLLSIGTLEVLTIAALHSLKGSDIPANAYFCPMIDARRMEVYNAFYDKDLHQVRETSADIIDENSYQEILNNHTVFFFGNGSSKCKKAIQHPNAKFLDDIVPLATEMSQLADEAYKKKDFKDVAYFEPAYLKEFIAVVGKNKVLGLENQK
ncbi:MAG: tRNA (adenosine(37)-N6)-threonylcarbamoyltransferase complex dimerization subunit type 1 TsaB [Paludibacteraceae bacterium]|nr:tRNA (adenosine(37)-N6)-threonylcarbamoyltransferase complex dimerization subunit type 1 TsaB [Paludibacteraceae bacterium]